MTKVLMETVHNIEMLSSSIYRLTVKSPYVSKEARPGQFVNIKCSEGLNALLRRPISICSTDGNKGTFDLIFQVKGAGTLYLSRKKAGDRLDIIAPLGTPFDLSEKYGRIAVVGGGIGIFPLLYILKQSKAAEKSAFLGFRSREQAVLIDEFGKAADELNIASDDGSIGSKGFITDLIKTGLDKRNYDIIYACGPLPMLKITADEARQRQISCQVSMEERMGCGIGACLVCACKTKLGDEWEYSHVCKDGPVFWSDRVIFE